MTIIYDDDVKIAEFKVKEYIAKLLKVATSENGNAERIFKASGISSLYEKYWEKLEPYRYNGQWQNDNYQYNPISVFLWIFDELDQKHRVLLLKECVERINFYRQNSIDEDVLKKSLEVLGYSLVKDDDKYTIKETSGLSINFEEVISSLENTIAEDYPNLLTYYNEAQTSYTSGQYVSCVDNCRTLLEKIIESLSSETSTDKKILDLVKEQIIGSDGSKITNKDKIYKYWIDNKKGANRYRLITTIYSVLSGLGPHGEDVPNQKDASLLLRQTESVLIWLLDL